MKLLLMLYIVGWAFGWNNDENQLVPYRLLRFGDKLVATKCNERSCKRNDGFAAVPLGSPLEGHSMKVICPMQDDHLESKDLSSLHLPHWIKTHKDPVGRCPIKLKRLEDNTRIWPLELMVVECACERSRCTSRGSHVCHTVYVARPVIKKDIGFTVDLIAVDCICAAQRARMIKLTLPEIVA